MAYTVVFELAGPLAGAVAVEWTDAAAPQGSGDGWEPCLRLGDGRWRLSSHDLAVVRPRHWRDPGLFANIGIRYRLTAGGPWSPVSDSRKEIVIVALAPEDEVPPPAPDVADWSAPAPLELAAGVFTAAFALDRAAVAVDWTAAAAPAAGDWRPCAALGEGRWHLDGAGSTVAANGGIAGIGIRYRRVPGGPASAVSADRKDFAAPVRIPPLMLAAPALVGTGKIGQELRLDPGLWSGEPVPVLAPQWRRDGADIPGATGATYVPGPADDLSEISARVAAASIAGSLQAETARMRVTQVAPVVVGELFDEVFDEDTGPQEIETAAAFAGAGLRFAVTGAGAGIDAATGRVSIPTGVPVDGARVTVTASNSGGSVALSFLVTIEAGLPAFPGAVPAGSWTAAEVTDPVEAGNVAGRRKATLAAAAAVPAGFALHVYMGDSPSAAPSPSLAALVPGGALITSNALAVGATCHPRLYWRRQEDGLFQVAGEKEPFVVQGLAQPGGFPRLPQAMVDDLIGRPLTDFGAFGGAGSNSGFFGAVLPLLAANSFAGDTSSDARLLQNLRHNVSAGHDPSGAGGFVAQLELNFAVAAAIARLTPRVWDQLTAAERTRIDIAMKAQLVANAFTSSDTNPYFTAGTSPQKNLRGGTAWRTGAPNFRCAAPAAVHAARVFLGSNAAVTAFLESFNMASFATLAQNNNLPAVYETYRTANRPATHPTAVQVQNAIKSWRYRGFAIADIQAMFLAEANFITNKPVMSGHGGDASNGWIGPGVSGRGRIMANAAGLPNKGQAGGMYNEFDTTDAGGVRSSASYVMFGARVILNWALVLAAAGLLDRSAANVRATRDRLDRAQTDLKYKSDNGYLSYSKGGEGSNNEDWTSTLADQWGWSYSFGMWTHLLKPYLDGA